ncbi:MAG: hypothetical protein PHC99_05190 [Methylococcales bacterium]|nr:hypothetical protein [Methylococcales bacterium]
MDKEKIVDELNNFKSRLNDEIYKAYVRGETYGTERFSVWRRKFTEFLELTLPNDSSRFQFTLNSGVLFGTFDESNTQRFWRLYGEKCESFIDSLIIDIQNDEYDFKPQFEEKVISDVSIVTAQSYEKGYAFIVMAINPDNHELADVLDSIKTVANQFGIHAERVDEVQTNERITDRILESIKKAEFVIVDLTHSRPNVFYEAGYAQGLNKTPIYIAKDGTHLEFDLKDYPVIFFKNMRGLRGELEARLKAIQQEHV